MESHVWTKLNYPRISRLKSYGEFGPLFFSNFNSLSSQIILKFENLSLSNVNYEEHAWYNVPDRLICISFLSLLIFIEFNKLSTLKCTTSYLILLVEVTMLPNTNYKEHILYN